MTRKTATHRPRPCTECNKLMIVRSSTQKYCDVCGSKIKRGNAIKAMSRHGVKNRERLSAKKREKYRQAVADGRCYTCGSDLDTGAVLCKKCWMKAIAYRQTGTRKNWTALLNMAEQQGWKCPYTGVDLVIGENMSLDHIQPKSRFPELAKNLDNLEWIDIRVNRAKHNMTQEEFLDFIRLIGNHR